MRGFFKVMLATAGFAAVHSLLASKPVKDAAAGRLPRLREQYRVLYNAHAAVAFGALVLFIYRQPHRTLYRARGAASLVLRAGQASGIAFAIAAARATGIVTLLGVDARTGTPPERPRFFDPAAQGPEAGEDGSLRIRGPFRFVRHPLNLAPLAPFWLTPHMTTRRLAFNCVATIYLVVGSLHEESRLRDRYGTRYESYRTSGVPFYLPRWRRRLTPSGARATVPSGVAPSPRSAPR